jgi:hypothetical protein
LRFCIEKHGFFAMGHHPSPDARQKSDGVIRPLREVTEAGSVWIGSMAQMVACLLHASCTGALIEFASMRGIFGNTQATVQQIGELSARAELSRLAKLRQMGRCTRKSTRRERLVGSTP